MKILLPIFSILAFVGVIQGPEVGRAVSGMEEELIAGETSKTWVTSKMYLNGVEVTGLNDPCNRNDLTIFYRDGKVLYEEGATKCDPNDPDLIDQTRWHLSDDGRALIIGSKGNTKIVKLTPSELILEEEQEGTVFREHLRPV